MQNTQKSFLAAIFLIIVAIALAGGTYWYFTNTTKNNYDEQKAILGAKGISNLLSENGEGSNGIQKEIAKRILNESNDTGDRVSLARILGESDTPEALATLIKVVFTTKNSELYRSTIEQMNRMGSPASKQQAKEMAKAAMDGWEGVAKSSKPELYYVFGGILAKLGDLEGTLFLRDEAVKGGSTLTALNTGGNMSAKVAMEASLGVRGHESDSIQMIADSLKANDPESTEFIWSGQALSSIGYTEGVSALVEWAKNAPDSCAEVAETWLSAFRDSHSTDVMLTLDIESIQFKSQKIKNAVAKAKEKYQKQYQQFSN